MVAGRVGKAESIKRNGSSKSLKTYQAPACRQITPEQALNQFSTLPLEENSPEDLLRAAVLAAGSSTSP